MLVYYVDLLTTTLSTLAVPVITSHVHVMCSCSRTETPKDPPKWNELDGAVDRRSYLGKYEIHDGVPRWVGYGALLKRHGVFVTFNLYCKIMLYGINLPIIAYRPSKDVFKYHLGVENRCSKGAYSVYTSVTRRF